LIKTTLRDINGRAGVTVPTIVNQIWTNKTPPTFVRTNKFTKCSQTIVDAYGIPKYSESNPGLYMVVTFPFIFAVMFGDFGHGALITMVATILIYWETKLGSTKLEEMIKMAFLGRYIMLMMGLFSMYTGLIYCDIFSRSFTIFQSQWK
jgi:V-type H+-transporting ATPase subunit a